MTWHPDIPAEWHNAVVTGDARLLAERLPAESVDLIFTDPVYDRIEDYGWLGRLAARALKPGGALLCWSNGRWHRLNANWLEAAGLCYRWEFACVIMGRQAPMNGKIIAKTNRLLWFDAGYGSRMAGYLADGYQSQSGGWGYGVGLNHAWTKNPVFMGQAIRCFTEAGSVVLDPFCGGGTVPAVCKQLGRHWIAFEQDPETATLARERVHNTPLPLFVLDAPPAEEVLQLEAL